MLLPQHFTIKIEPLRLSAYLLNLSHPAGWGKAKYFHKHGVTFEPILKALLLKIIDENEVIAVQPNDFGVKYLVDGVDEETTISLRTVWVILAGENICKFVTAYPL